MTMNVASANRSCGRSKSASISALIVGVMFFIGAVTPSVSLAAASKARSVIYLDGNDNIIGHQFVTCSNFAQHAGVINADNPYKIVETSDCGINDVIQMGITSFHPATGKSTQYYCNSPHPAGTPFDGSPPCGLAQPEAIEKLAPYQGGYQ